MLKPLRDFTGTEDPNWWGKAYEFATEESVRAVLSDDNGPVVVDRMRPTLGPTIPMAAPTADVEDMVRQWRDLSAADEPARRAAHGSARETADRRMPWWRLLGRRRAGLS